MSKSNDFHEGEIRVSVDATGPLKLGQTYTLTLQHTGFEGRSKPPGPLPTEWLLVSRSAALESCAPEDTLKLDNLRDGTVIHGLKMNRMLPMEGATELQLKIRPLLASGNLLIELLIFVLREPWRQMTINLGETVT